MAWSILKAHRPEFQLSPYYLKVPPPFHPGRKRSKRQEAVDGEDVSELEVQYRPRVPCFCQPMALGKPPTRLLGPPAAQVCNSRLARMTVRLHPRPELWQFWVSTLAPQQRAAPLCLVLTLIHFHPNTTSGGVPETYIMGQGGNSSGIMKDDVERVHHPSSKPAMRVGPELTEVYSLKSLLGTGQGCMIGSCFRSWWKVCQFYSVTD